QRSGSATIRTSVRSNWSRKASPKPGCRSSYHSAAVASSSSASGWLTTRMELVANLLDNLPRRTTTNFAFLDFTGAPVNDLVPLCLGVGVHGVFQTGNELAGQIRPIFFGQGQHLGHFLGGNAHATKISSKPPVLASSITPPILLLILIPSNRILHNRRETPRLQRRPAHQRAVHVRLPHQLPRVVRLHAAAVLDAHLGRGRLVEHLFQHSANEMMRLLRLRRRRRLARADGPHRLV